MTQSLTIAVPAWRRPLALFGGAGIASRLARHTVWAVLGSAAGQGLAFLAAMLAARLLGADSFGRLSVTMATVNVFSIFAVAGLGTTATKHVAEFRVSDPARAGRIAGFAITVAALSGLLCAVVLATAAPLLDSTLFKSAGLAVELRLGAVLLLFAALNGAQTGALTGLEAFPSLARFNALKGALTIVLVSLGALRFGVAGALAGHALSAAVASVYSHHLIRAGCRSSAIVLRYFDWREQWPLVRSFSLPVLAASLFFIPANWWATTLLARTHGYAETGLFAAAQQFQNVCLFFSSSLATVALPTLSSAVPERNARKFGKLLLANTALTAVAVGSVALTLALLAPVVMGLYGAEFRAGSGVLRILCAAAALGTLNTAVPHAIWSLNQTRAGVLFSVLRSALLAVSATLLVGGGAMGIAFAFLAVAAIQALVECAYLWRLFRRFSELWQTAPAQS